MESKTLNQLQTNKETIKKLQWQCRRGMLELDVVLIPFLNEHFDSLTQRHQMIFEELLNESDPDLYTWIMGFGSCDNENFKEVIHIIRDKMAIA